MEQMLLKVNWMVFTNDLSDTTIRLVSLSTIRLKVYEKRKKKLNVGKEGM